MDNYCQYGYGSSLLYYIIKMLKIRKFKLGINQQYRGFSIIFYRLKIEIIVFGDKRMYRIEWNDWTEK